MPIRSQRHSREVHGSDAAGWTPGAPRFKAITGILPDTPSAPRLGQFPRIVFPLTSIGGKPPYKWTLVDNVGLMLVNPIGENLVVASSDPIGPPGDYDLVVNVVDALDASFTETVRLTLW